MGIAGEKKFHRDTDHRELCRFKSEDDPDYRIILHELKDMLLLQQTRTPCT